MSLANAPSATGCQNGSKGVITRIAAALTAAAGGFLLSGCAPSTTAQAPLVAQSSHAAEIVTDEEIGARFPGATILDEAEFGSAIVGRRFRYRHVGTEIVVERPGEVFAENGRYEIHWLRGASYGTYSIKQGVVSIDCSACSYDFLSLGRKRVFFWHEGRLLTISADGRGSVVELLPEVLEEHALRALLSGVYVEPLRPTGGVIAGEWPGEVFRSDGHYMQISNRSRREGTFLVRGDLVCVGGRGIKYRCRQVASTGKGDYTFTDVSDGSSEQVTITPHK
jgi:hypothetical protein